MACIFTVRLYFSTSLSNDIMLGNIVPQKTWTAKSHTKDKNKWLWDLLVSYGAWKGNISKAYCLICLSAKSATFSAADVPCWITQWMRQAKQTGKKARCQQKTHTVMAMKKKDLWILGTNLWHSCSVVANSPPRPQILHTWERCFADCAWLSVWNQFTNWTG